MAQITCFRCGRPLLHLEGLARGSLSCPGCGEHLAGGADPTGSGKESRAVHPERSSPDGEAGTDTRLQVSVALLAFLMYAMSLYLPTASLGGRFRDPVLWGWEAFLVGWNAMWDFPPDDVRRLVLAGAW